jgi:DNA-binding beta-propeller fold protein YncE
LLHVLFLLAACQKPAEPKNTDGTSPPTDTGTVHLTDTSVPHDTGDSAVPIDTGTPVTVDCSAVLGQPISVTELDRPRGYHGLAFDPDGNIIGSDGNNLIKVAFDGTMTPWALGLGTVQEMDWLPDGDLAVAVVSTGAIVRISPEGTGSPIATDVGAYGIRVGPDGMIYASNEDKLYRIDPDTGDKTSVFPDVAGFSPQVVEWSPDNTRIYIGNHGGGEIYYADLDAEFLPVGNPTLLTSGVGSGPYMDCMVVDECGNIYACDYSQNNLYRISPDGNVGLFVNHSSNQYGHGAVFGVTTGGWNEHAIYQPQPYDGDTVIEIDIGVRGRDAVAP